MKTLTIDLPDSVDEHELTMQLAGYLFERGLLSAGQAANLAGINKVTFLETAGQYGISIFGESEEDIRGL